MLEESQKASGDSQPNVSDVIVNKDTVSYDSHKKLLGEKKSLQTKFESMQSEIEAFRQDKLQAEGKKDDVITSLREQLTMKTQEAKELKNNFAWTTIQGQIKNEASAQGCVNPNKLVKLLSKDQIGGIEIDDNFNVNKEDLTKLISDARKEHADIGLFSVKKININDVSGKVPQNKPKAPSEMTKEELEEAIRNAE